MESRKNFSSKIGIVLASAGSAVGLGNVWRFPTEVGNNGGAAFIIVYLLCILLIGVPVMMSEFLIGRHTHANTITAYAKLAPGKWWRIEGVSGVAVAMLILSYYIVISGWTLYYLIYSLSGQLQESRDYKALFDGFVAHPWLPVLTGAAFMAMTHLIIARGVQSGIERFSKVMMPMLLLIIGILVVCSLGMPGSAEGLRFLLRPDFTKLTGKVILSAIGQAFFSLSLAMGCLCTYASYFGPGTKLPKTAMSVSLIDTFVAILSGFIIFPAVFSVEGVGADAGPGLVFITLPNVFNMAFAAIPFLGYVFSGLFYLLLLLAALTSAMSLHESVTAYVLERFGLSRKRAAALVSVCCMTLGVACSLSFGSLSDFKIADLTIFAFLDGLTTNVFLPLVSLAVCIYMGWFAPKGLLSDELSNYGTMRSRVTGAVLFIIRYIAPVLIALIFIFNFI